MSTKDIIDRFISTDGIAAVVVIGSDDPTHAEVGGMNAELRQAIAIARIVGDQVDVLIGHSTREGQRRIVTALWPNYHIAVESVVGHKVNKSLRRILFRTGRKLGGLKTKLGPAASPSVSEREFVNAPGEVLSQAEVEPVTVTKGNGEPTAVVSVPRDQRPAPLYTE